jgi:hypothetical protein
VGTRHRLERAYSLGVTEHEFGANAVVAHLKVLGMEPAQPHLFCIELAWRMVRFANLPS